MAEKLKFPVTNSWERAQCESDTALLASKMMGSYVALNVQDVISALSLLKYSDSYLITFAVFVPMWNGLLAIGT